jgi:pimeloyl-ACP methyl ester carboxylesterase
MKYLSIFVILIAAVYFGAIIYLYVTQEDKIFNRKWAKPYEPVNAKKIYFTTNDGIKLEGAITINKKNAPLVLYFSGNANNVIEFLDKVAVKIKNYNFIGFNYPGYANSQGKPCEQCILSYAIEIYDKYKPDIIIGRSLGSAVATYVAKNRKIKKLVLLTPFDSIVNIAKAKYPFLPVDKLVKYKFEEYKWIKDVDVQVNILLVKNDDIIPNSSTKRLLKNIKHLNKIIEIDNIKHGFIYEYNSIDKIIEMLLKD